MTQTTTHRILRPRHWALLAAIGSVGLVSTLAGCEDDASTQGTMVMQPTTTGGERSAPPATQPSTPDDELAAEDMGKAYITVTDERGEAMTYEFPPAKLWLRSMKLADAGEAPRVRSLLFSDDPAEALSSDWGQHSFHFEMDLELPSDVAEEVSQRVAEGEEVEPADLAYAEWVYSADATKRSDSPSGIFLATGDGQERRLQPADVFVNFSPLGEDFVVVTLVGDFAEFEGPDSAPTIHNIRVRAVLTAETIRR